MRVVPPYSAVPGRSDLAAESLRHQLVAVADAEHRNTEVEDRRVNLRASRLVDARRTTRKDDARGVPRSQFCRRQIVRDDLGIDVRLTYAPGDELRVLRAQVDDEDGTLGWAGHPQWPIPSRCWVWYVFPSVLIDGAMTSSAFWNSLIVA